MGGAVVHSSRRKEKNGEEIAKTMLTMLYCALVQLLLWEIRGVLVHSRTSTSTRSCSMCVCVLTHAYGIIINTTRTYHIPHTTTSYIIILRVLFYVYYILLLYIFYIFYFYISVYPPYYIKNKT